MINQKHFTTPKLCTCNDDLSKSWYVYFYFTDKPSGIKKIYRYKLGINRFHTKKERVNEGSTIASLLLVRLNDGWNPMTSEIEDEQVQKDVLVVDAIDQILSVKKSFLTKRSYKTYYDHTELFKKWLKASRFSHLYIQNFDKLKAQAYLDYLLRDRKYSGKSHNANLSTLKTFFTAILERYPVMGKSPFDGIKQVPEEKGKNTTYSKLEEERIEKYLLKHDINFYYATRFVRYCFFRRSELSKLQIKHINWENKTISVPSEIAKTRRQDSVTISKSLERIIEKMGILSLDPEMYIFSKGFIPGYDKLKRVDDFSDKQREVNKLLHVKHECTFYSWKHTGVCDLYNSMKQKDVYVVMRQCRHSDIKMTMIYLRSLGLVVNEDVREW